MTDSNWTDPEPTTPETIEPRDYFDELKSKINKVQKETLDGNLQFLAHELEKARKLGQTNLSHKSAYMWQILEKEMALHALGYEDFVYRQDVVKLIDSVTPRNSVKIVELENFPRAIPDQAADAIQTARDLELFDLLIVVYTDLTDEEVNTPEQKQFAARNRDPIVFGMFLNDKLDLKHDRMYFIVDWEDEYCDLTFSRMLDMMAERGVGEGHKITVDQDNINRLVSEALAEVEQIKDIRYRDLKPKEKTSFVSRIKNWFNNDSRE